MKWYKTSAMPEALNTQSDLFDSREWAGVLSVLGARCWHGIEQETDARVSLFVWQKGPVKVGYLGFPVTPEWIVASSRPWDLNQMPERVHLLRSNVSSLEATGFSEGVSVVLPESVIPDLRVWPNRNRQKNRRAAARAVRHGVTVRDALPWESSLIYGMYQQTISRHHGRLRYSETYFKSLIELSAKSQSIQVRLACMEGGVIGFCVTASQSVTGYYLHAGIEGNCRHLGAADILADDAIGWAISAGCRRFSFMASPPKQPGLHKFKEKWSEQDGKWLVADRTAGIAGKLIALAMKLR